MGTKLIVKWKYFSLEQINSQQGPNWKVWEQSGDYPAWGLHAFRAAEAARRQGEPIFEVFHMALLKAKHEQHCDIADSNTIMGVAESTGLEMAQFKEDFSNRQLLMKLAEHHCYAVEKLGIFGTPTLVFPERQAIFFKMSMPPPAEECLDVFTELQTLACRRRNILEIKRP
jgi:predicted DsbA family dithiol-disulfide isomerase